MRRASVQSEPLFGVIYKTKDANNLDLPVDLSDLEVRRYCERQEAGIRNELKHLNSTSLVTASGAFREHSNHGQLAM